ncbi:MAG: 30S ribosomal protein S20 [Candidatus Woesebacteria bacterium GW2011_GWA1_45_8]|uniref:Small ribosomal subunit protein bS20 n=1 Tax=Candidatus Woesebacteria bacterium GW2011_GWA1_45_8 TaxID=1618559 RepID=A0A0G1MVJ6_9BACT|nr:MAG: 30S ribosomal protein S20 [Candidatus Woesebacteria bacterium GW2011_GWA1_45_8]
MPVTKTAKRALRGSARKSDINKLIVTRLEIAVRKAKKSKSADKILAAISLADITAKKRAVHKNKAARIKSALSKLLPKAAVGAKASKATKQNKKSGKSPRKVKS